mgnify:CR=1 FL=1
MSNIFQWQLHGDGKTLAPGEVVEPDERLTWVRTAGIGAQHVIAMFGATFLVPILTGFDPSTTLFFTLCPPHCSCLSTGTCCRAIWARPSLHCTDHRGLHRQQGHCGRQLRHHGHRYSAGPGWRARALRRLQMDRHHHAARGQRRDCGHHRLQSGTFRVDQLPSRARHRTGYPVGRAARGRAVQGLAGPPQYFGRRDHRLCICCIRGQVDFSAIGDAAWIGFPKFHLPQADFSILPMFIPVVLVLVLRTSAMSSPWPK